MGKIYRIYGHILEDPSINHCYISSSYVKCISLHMKKIVEWYWEMDWGPSMCLWKFKNINLKSPIWFLNQVMALTWFCEIIGSISIEPTLNMILKLVHWIRAIRKSQFRVWYQAKNIPCLKTTCYHLCNSKHQWKHCTPLLIHLKEVQNKEPSSRLENNLH